MPIETFADTGIKALRGSLSRARLIRSIGPAPRPSLLLTALARISNACAASGSPSLGNAVAGWPLLIKALNHDGGGRYAAASDCAQALSPQQRADVQASAAYFIAVLRTHLSP